MRGRMNESSSFAAPQPLDAVMIGGTVGEVVGVEEPALRRRRDKVVAWAAGRSTSLSTPTSAA